MLFERSIYIYIYNILLYCYENEHKCCSEKYMRLVLKKNLRVVRKRKIYDVMRTYVCVLF